MAYFDCIVGGSSGDGSTLTVTCYSGFAGLTISITNGVDTFSDVCPSTSPYEVVFEGLANGTWTLSTVYNGVTYTETVEVNLTSQFYPIPNGATATPTNDIQTWLHCADIWDKSYTTINQVLADTSTLLALISSNNAADYMARSTSWASAVCANQTAMGYIGNNDYCADTLLADATWLNAICNSTYFESVLNVKVPTMTSNTTPYGEANAYREANTDRGAWRAFDGDDSSTNYYSNGVARTTSDYLQYKFTNPTCVKRVRVKKHTASSTLKVLKIRASHNGTDFVDLGTIDVTSIVDNSVDIKGSESYLYYRIQNNDSSSEWMSIDTVQFYGRT